MENINIISSEANVDVPSSLLGLNVDNVIKSHYVSLGETKNRDAVVPSSLLGLNVDNVIKSHYVPKVIQNSDYLYKSDIKWVSDIEYIEPNQFEKDMLKGTKTAKEIIEEEQEELNKIKILTDEEKLIQKKKNCLTMFQIIALNRLKLNILLDASKLQNEQKEAFKAHVNSLIEDYNNGFEIDIEREFNSICNEKLFNCGKDVSNYPVYS